MLNEQTCRPTPPFRHWLRHMAAVPKGFLRYQVLELLDQKPLSGSEIISEIHKRTNGCWKPSPGSVYPLLAWLQDSGYIKEVPSEESGIKRYTLTERGKKLLEEQRKVCTQLRMDRLFFVSPFMSSLWLHIPGEEIAEARESFRRVLKALVMLSLTLEERFSEQAVKEVLKILNEAAQKLEEVEKRLRGEDG